MPRKGTKLSPEAAERQQASIKAWHAENTEKIIFAVRKGKREKYKALAACRGISLSKLIQDYLDAECESEGI